MMNETTWMPVEQLAEVLNVSKATIYDVAIGKASWADPRAMRIERREATSTERARAGRRMRYVYRLRGDEVRAELVLPERAPKAELSAEPSELRDVTISWEQFAVEHEGETYLSLRKMVEVGGLYASFWAAKRALERCGLTFSTTLQKSTGGRPAEDCLMGWKDAQRFAAQSGTEVGMQIAAVIVDHHNEYQAIRAGDVEATTHAIAPAMGGHLDLMQGLLDSLKAQESAIRKHEAALNERPTRSEVMQMVGSIGAVSASISAEEQLDVWAKVHDANVAIVARSIPASDRLDADGNVVQANYWVNLELKRQIRKPKGNWKRRDYLAAFSILTRFANEYESGALTPLPAALGDRLSLPEAS